jgi:CRISPR/Cas system CMR-associated protein Cmr3 (group 5 of RAMP superfamily)
MKKDTIKNVFTNSIYAQMWRENPQFRKDIKTAFAVFMFGVLLFTYGSIKGCCMDKKAQIAKTESVSGKENIESKPMLNSIQLFRKSNFELQR